MDFQLNQIPAYADRHLDDPSDDKLLNVVEKMFSEIYGRLNKLNLDAVQLADRVFGPETEGISSPRDNSQVAPPTAQRIRSRFEEVSAELSRAERLMGRLNGIA
jgi:hypothetical protein